MFQAIFLPYDIGPEHGTALIETGGDDYQFMSGGDAPLALARAAMLAYSLYCNDSAKPEIARA